MDSSKSSLATFFNCCAFYIQSATEEGGGAKMFLSQSNMLSPVTFEIGFRMLINTIFLTSTQDTYFISKSDSTFISQYNYLHIQVLCSLWRSSMNTWWSRKGQLCMQHHYGMDNCRRVCYWPSLSMEEKVENDLSCHFFRVLCLYFGVQSFIPMKLNRNWFFPYYN